MAGRSYIYMPKRSSSLSLSTKMFSSSLKITKIGEVVFVRDGLSKMVGGAREVETLVTPFHSS